MEEKKEIITPKDLPRLLKENPDINFIGWTCTPWQAIGVDAALMRLQKEGEKLKGICFVEPKQNFGYLCTTENAYVNTFSKRYYYEPSNSPYSRSEWRKNHYRFVFKDYKKTRDDNTLYIVEPFCNIVLGVVAYTTLPHRHICFVQSDEGVAPYLGTLEADPPKIHSIHSFLSFCKFELYRKKDKMFKSHFDYFNCRIFLQEKDKSISLNHVMVPYFKESIERKTRMTIGTSFDVDLRDSVVICTTAWFRNEIKDDEDLKVLINVCDYIYAKGHKIILKPHPRDEFFAKHAKDLHADILGYSIPIETICAITQPKAMIGFSTTALETAKLFWNIPVFCISNMLDRTKLSHFYLREIDNFKLVFRKLIKFVDNVEEIDIPI